MIGLSHRLNLQMAMLPTLNYIQSLGALGPVLFVVIYNLATVLMLPASLLSLGAGVLYGIGWGTVYVLIAALIGATLAFLIGRHVSRDWVRRQMQDHPQFRAIETAIAREGLRFVFLVRLSPIVPFNLLNYALGLTPISLRDYVIGSFGIVPGTFLYVSLGALAGDLTDLRSQAAPVTPQTQILNWTLQAFGILTTLAVTIYLTKVTRAILKSAEES